MIWTALIVPAFFVFLGLEYWIARRKKRPELFHYENSVSNITIGIAERVLNLLITGSFYKVYDFIYTHYSLTKIPNHWTVWIILLLFTDLVWYWYHRLGHEINLLWGAHIVHHQSEDFNYTVSARITTLQAIVRNLFWCALPLAGFAPEMVIAILAVHGTYSFFTHTQVIGKLGWLEKIFITPTHHGVHHASNEKYLNKNYGDIFIFWDKLFGTFQKEEEKPAYGLTHPLKSHSFFWQHFHYYAELVEACRRSGSLIQSIKIIFGKPEDLDQSIRTDLEKKLFSHRRKLNPSHAFRFKAYVNLQLLIVLIATWLFPIFYPYLTALEVCIIILLILLTLVNCGALLEQKRWIFDLELIRLATAIAYGSYIVQSPLLLLIGSILLYMISFSDYLKYLYFRVIFGKPVLT